MIGEGQPLKRKFCIKRITPWRGTMLISTFMKFDQYSICIAIIIMEYEITNNVH